MPAAPRQAPIPSTSTLRFASAWLHTAARRPRLGQRECWRTAYPESLRRRARQGCGRLRQDVEDGERAQDPEEDAIDKEVVVFDVCVWRGLAVPRYEPNASVKPPGVFYVSLPPWSGQAGQVAQGAATDPQL